MDRPCMTPQAGNFTEVFLKPRTLRTLYGVPDGEHGGWAGKGNNRQGVAAFDDFYLAVSLSVFGLFMAVMTVVSIVTNVCWCQPLVLVRMFFDWRFR